jgi:uncharacterized membrane protein
MKKKKGDKHSKSVIKSFSWRAIATLTTMFLVFIFTGKTALALGVGFFDVTLKLIFYYFHERAWNNVKWGTHS